jgi:competence protein ComEC
MTAQMAMYFLDVGQGDCTYLEVGSGGTADQELYLIDFGYKQRQFNGDHPAYQTLAILVDRITKVSKARGLDEPYLDHLFITHPDSDHWDMIFALVSGTAADLSNLWEKQGWPKGTTLKVGTLTYGGAPKDYSGKSDRHLIWWSTITAAAATKTILGNKAHDDQDEATGAVDPRWTGLGGKLSIYLINSNYPQKTGGTANPKSLCLIFEFDGFRLMLLGDAEPTTVGAQLKTWYPYDNYAFLQCDVLKLAHHGSRAGTPDWWPKLVKPKYAYVSGDYFWSHPYQEALANVFAAKTLNATFFNHWAASYDDTEKDYKPFQTEKAMFSSLWYVVTSATPVKARNEKGTELTYGKGQYIGIAWLLQKFEGEATPETTFSPEDVWPGIGQVPS